MFDILLYVCDTYVILCVSGSSSPLAEVVGGVLGAVLIIVVIAFAIIYYFMRQKLKSGQKNNGTHVDMTEIATVPTQPIMMTYQGLVSEQGDSENDNNAIGQQNIPNEYYQIQNNNYCNLPPVRNEANTYEDVNPYENPGLNT